MANRYWIGGSGDWGETAHWSTTSGGSGGSAVPTSSDNVYFDANSGSGTVTVNNYAECNDFSTVGYTGFFDTFAFGDAYGNVAIGGASGAGGFRLSLYGENKTLSSAGASLNQPDIEGSYTTTTDIETYGGGVRGTLELGGAFSFLGETPSFELNGSLVTNGYDLSADFLIVYSGATFDIQNSTVRLGSQDNSFWGSTIQMRSGATIKTAGSTININNTTSWGTFTAELGGYTYNIVNLGGSYPIILKGDNSFTELSVSSGQTIKFGQGSTQAITTFSAIGTSTRLVKLRSSTSGAKYTLKKYTGTVSAQYIDVQDSTVTGGATWNATNSLDSGNNIGWNFLGPQPPVANFTASKTAPFKGQVVSFTDTSINTPTSWSWNFGDGGTSTTQNPTHTYTTDGIYTVSLTATNGIGSNTKTRTNYITVTTETFTRSGGGSYPSDSAGTPTFEKATIDVGGSYPSVSNVLAISVYQPVDQIILYEYRVFDGDTFVGVWQDVDSPFSYTQAINQTPTELSVELARAPDNKVVKVDELKDSTGSVITDENGDTIYAWTETANTVGEGTDVQEDYNVDVYKFYGGYDQLLDSDGNIILDSNGDSIYVQFGQPNGKRVYAGYIADYSLNYGTSTGVTVTVAPRSAKMTKTMFKDGSGNTTISYTGADPVQMGRDAMDYYASVGRDVIYDASSMPLTTNTANYDFTAQSIKDVIDQTINLLPAGYYEFVDPGENKQYIQEKGTTADHIFYYEQHIGELSLKKTLTQLVNQVYFTGGDTGTGEYLYTYDEDVTSVETYGPYMTVMSDSRVTDAASAHALAQQQIAQFKDPRYTTQVTITDAVYDIETIKMGDMVGFKNFGTYVDDLILQIVNVNRQPHMVILDLDMIIPTDTKRLYELKKQLQSEQVRAIGSAPV